MKIPRNRRRVEHSIIEVTLIHGNKAFKGSPLHLTAMEEQGIYVNDIYEWRVTTRIFVPWVNIAYFTVLTDDEDGHYDVQVALYKDLFGSGERGFHELAATYAQEFADMWSEAILLDGYLYLSTFLEQFERSQESVTADDLMPLIRVLRSRQSLKQLLKSDIPALSEAARRVLAERPIRTRHATRTS